MINPFKWVACVWFVGFHTYGEAINGQAECLRCGHKTRVV